MNVFVFNAGVHFTGDPLDMRQDDIEQMIDVNIRSAYYACVEAGRKMP